MKHEFPAELALVQVDCTSAGNASNRPDAVSHTVIEIDLATEVLVASDQCRRRKAQKSYRVRHITRLPRFNERGIERDVGAAFAHTGIDNPEALRHAVRRYSRRTGISSCLRIFFRSFFFGGKG